MHHKDPNDPPDDHQRRAQSTSHNLDRSTTAASSSDDLNFEKTESKEPSAVSSALSESSDVFSEPPRNSLDETRPPRIAPHVESLQYSMSNETFPDDTHLFPSQPFSNTPRFDMEDQILPRKAPRTFSLPSSQSDGASSVDDTTIDPIFAESSSSSCISVPPRFQVRKELRKGTHVCAFRSALDEFVHRSQNLTHLCLTTVSQPTTSSRPPPFASSTQRGSPTQKPDLLCTDAIHTRSLGLQDINKSPQQPPTAHKQQSYSSRKTTPNRTPPRIVNPFSFDNFLPVDDTDWPDENEATPTPYLHHVQWHYESDPDAFDANSQYSV